MPNSYAVGWHSASAPLGTSGNTVLNGHHNVHGQVFRRLIELEPGDLVALFAGAVEFDYYVSERLVLAESGQPLEARLTNAGYILPTPDERVTLITCWPYTGNSHRLVVIARPEP